MTDEEMNEQQRGVVQDRKRYFRHNELENGNDPVKSGESIATDWALQHGSMPPEDTEGGFTPQPDDASDLWQEKNEPG